MGIDTAALPAAAELVESPADMISPAPNETGTGGLTAERSPFKRTALSFEVLFKIMRQNIKTFLPKDSGRYLRLPA